MTNRERIAQAVVAMQRIDAPYWTSTLEQRAEFGKPAGSVVLGVTPEELQQLILKAEWESYSHESVLAGCSAFKAPIKGRLGVVSLATLPVETLVTLDDRKNTGKVSAVVKGVLGAEVDFTVLILGVEDGVEVVFTFHPGDPVRPSQIQTESGMHGRQVTVLEARDMGLEMVKIV
jgi:hypothetical protein